MKFEQALSELRNGSKVAREGWNGKGMFIYLVEHSVVPFEKLRGNAAKHINKIVTGRNDAYIHAHIDMKTSDGKVLVGWNPSQFELLAEDWIIVD